MITTTRHRCRVYEQSTGELVAANAVCVIAEDSDADLSAWSGRFDTLPGDAQERLTPGGYTLRLDDGREGSIVYGASSTTPPIAPGIGGAVFQGSGLALRRG